MILAECSIISPTSIYSYKEQWSGVLCRSSPVTDDGFGRTGRTKPIAADCQSPVFIEGVFDCG